MNIECRLAAAADWPAIEQLLELYQYDLSELWIQDLDSNARYGYDLARHRRAERSFAHGLRVDGHWAGFALVAPACVTRSAGHWMEQFFVLKRWRRMGCGRRLAAHAITSHPGPWEIGQIAGNDAATAFWRAVIAGLAPGGYDEVEVREGWWQGIVQRFDCPGDPR